MRRRIATSTVTAILVAGAMLAIAPRAHADPIPRFDDTSAPATASSGSSACAQIINGAANGLAARIQADDATIVLPTPVNRLSCLSNLFGGVGLDLVTSLLSPSQLIGTIEKQVFSQICTAAQQVWSETLGSAQCGLTITGFNLGFGLGLGSGLMCPHLTFGGGGPPIGGIGSTLNNSQSYGVYVTGNVPRPTGYPSIGRGGLY